ncbi:MAG: cupin-like domain-containing protein [Drouetiella hepatica Uher 2000/2452]|jgi:lysine-specific demethylase 8/hypoxia-inducible factor 1-alpha inhibitor (HIF hydroxylase)|uniref:Cupin-like domain-containing protein n=1 Tax=Drouetiella hepatica Uher 2000/2452 TaxID=904376 RepID=A0A951QFL8_9CYAN|nr:cupin-like domain-containing protein [Drouetiella hepatica Uher 2000/2452]
MRPEPIHSPNQLSELPLPRSSSEISKISIAALTPDLFIRRYRKPGVPVILTGMISSEQDWTLNYLSEKLNQQEFLLRRYGKQRYQQDKRTWTNIGSGVPPESRSFLDYAELLRSGEAQAQDIYLAKCPIHNTPLANTEAVEAIAAHFETLGLQQPASALNLWVGPGGHTECLHYDPTDGTLIQLHGSKQIVLFPPAQTANLYPFPFYVHLRHGMRVRSWFSRVYPNHPDFEAFPKLRHAMGDRYDLVLEPGEVLYIPAGWWHEVTALGDEMVCSLNRFWQVPPRRALLSWPRWRAFLGSTCALPNVGFSLVMAFLSRDRQQKIKEIIQMF